MKCIIAALILLTLATPAWAGYDEGWKAYYREDYATALREIRPLAEQGHAAAQFIVGAMYLGGNGVRRDNTEAVKWFRNAAEQGYAFAQFHLGMAYNEGKGVPQDGFEAVRWLRKAAGQCIGEGQIFLGALYADGRGVAQDYAEAVRWFRKAAGLGLAIGQTALGEMYREGKGVPQDDTKAVRWLRKAAEQGFVPAQPTLGLMYETGKGVPQDYVQAHKWYNLAASQGDKDARKKRHRVENRMTRRQLAEAQRLASSWKPKKNKNRALFTNRADLIKDPLHLAFSHDSPFRDFVYPFQGQRIARIQRQLATLGYNVGEADCILGPKTRYAIRAFEAREELPVTGDVSEGVEAALRSASPVIARKTPRTTRQLKKTATGSGFFVSPAGHVLTNQHVVAKCREVRVAGAKTVKQIAVGGKIDLALLKVAPSERSTAKFRDGGGIRTGDDIIVTGYPLHGLLSSDLNVTKGIVSALSGLGDDRSFIQITAPVQPGNSGGPVLDSSGNVVGVVVSRLNALRFAKITGTLPQNVNFAISEGTARAFLDSHDVPYDVARSDKTVPTADIAAKAKGYTVLVECWK